MDNNYYFIPNYGNRNICFTKGKGVHLQDDEGRTYLDFGSGIAVNNLGYGHPMLVESLKNQAEKLWHISNFWHNQAAINLAKELCKRTYADKVFLCNSGLEANEAALKLARKYGNETQKNKNKIVCFSGAFHGRSLFTAAVSGKKEHKKPFMPLPQRIIRGSFNDASNAKDGLENIMDYDVCALIVEPIQGEGGVIPAKKDFLLKARKLCDKYNALLIFDEIQCGMGRTGRLFAYQDYNIIPDLMTCGKGLGGGFPISALLAKKEYAKYLTPGSHGSTFGGNALAAAVGYQTLILIDNPQLLQSVRKAGDYIYNSLQDINTRYNCFSDIRGRGLLWGAALNCGYTGKDIRDACLKKGLVILLAGEGDVLRLAPPLIIDMDSLSLCLSILEQTLAENI